MLDEGRLVEEDLLPEPGWRFRKGRVLKAVPV